MSLLGKILAVFNIFGVLALLVLASVDYGKRQEYAYAVLRTEIALEGIPLNEEEENAQGHPRVEQLSEKTMSDILSQVSSTGPANPTLIHEVAFYKKKFTDRLNSMVGADGKPQIPQQTQLLARVLLPLADSYIEREELLACRHYFASDANRAKLKERYKQAFDRAKERSRDAIIPGKAPMSFEEAMHLEMRGQRGEPSARMTTRFVDLLPADAAKIGDVKFDDAWITCLEAQHKALVERMEDRFGRVLLGVTGPNTNDGKKRLFDQKRGIARLLFAVSLAHAEEKADNDPAFKNVIPGTADYGQRIASSQDYQQWVRRCFFVCGLRTTLAAIIDETELCQKLVAEGALVQDRDLSVFVADNTTIVEDLRDRAELVRQELRRAEDSGIKLETQKSLVLREAEKVRNLQAELKKSREESMEVAKKLREASELILKKRQEVRKAIADTEAAEKKIRELEAIIRSAERSQKQ